MALKEGSTAIMTTKSALPIAGQKLKINGKFYGIESELYDGPFSKVYIVSCINEGGEQFAMKLERAIGPNRAVLKLDALVLKQLNNEKSTTCGFPRLIAAGRTSLYKYIIMELVGPDLQRIRRALPTKRGNDGVVMEKRRAAGLMGTIYYAPLAAHAFSDQCRRDDLESWLYMLIEITSGLLPWQKCDPKSEYMLIGDWKRFAREAGRYLLFDGCPKEYDSILRIIDETGYYARPDYNAIFGQLRQTASRLRIDMSIPFEWQLNERLIRKSAFVGERGESYLASQKLNNNYMVDKEEEHKTGNNNNNNNNSPPVQSDQHDQHRTQFTSYSDHVPI